jgi:hypothetical protein
MLVERGHVVAGLTRSQGELVRSLGAEPIVCDVYDAARLRDLVRAFAPDVVVSLLTDLPDDIAELPDYLERNARIRREGVRNLRDAAPDARLIAESVTFDAGPRSARWRRWQTSRSASTCCAVPEPMTRTARARVRASMSPTPQRCSLTRFSSAADEPISCNDSGVPAPQAIATQAVVARVHAPARYSVAGRAPLLSVSVWPRPGSRVQPARYVVRLARVHGRWRVAAVSGGPRVCRQTIGGERDPDPGSTMLSC